MDRKTEIISLSLSLSLSLSPFNRPFSRWTWVSRCLLKQWILEVVATTGDISRAKLQSNHRQQTNIQFFYRPDALPVAQPTVSNQSTEGMTEMMTQYRTVHASAWCCMVVQWRNLSLNCSIFALVTLFEKLINNRVRAPVTGTVLAVSCDWFTWSRDYSDSDRLFHC